LFLNTKSFDVPARTESLADRKVELKVGTIEVQISERLEQEEREERIVVWGVSVRLAQVFARSVL
jgi:hypothetical protein